MTEETQGFARSWDKGAFPTALSTLAEADVEDGETPRTLVELEVSRLAGEMRDKPQWWVKVEDEAIVAKWRSEYSGIDERFRYALAETRWVASQFQRPEEAHPAAVDGVFCADDFDESLRQRIVEGARSLRARPAIGSAAVDRHPGTPQMVDLVHPSLYCYERGVTRVLEDGDASTSESPLFNDWDQFVGCSRGTKLDEDALMPEEEPTQRGYRRRKKKKKQVLASERGLRWLPCEVLVTEDKCSFCSYVNSLHPKKERKMYGALEDLFLRTVPLFEECLAELGTEEVQREVPLRIDADAYGWYATDEEPSDDEAYEEWYENRDLAIPEIAEFNADEKLRAYYDAKKTVSLRNRPLQVIVKVASLEIAAGEAYKGGSWHVEGVKDEHIVATACCYVDSQNITGGDLFFRTAVSEPEYEQGDNRGVFAVYGLEDEEPLIQPRGKCSTPQGRLLVWPNTLQHCVAKTELQDSTKPGHRTIVCFFLVDPSLRVRSTATVPPQQLAWLEEEISALLLRLIPELAVRRLVASYVGGHGLISYSQACARRLELMDERRAEFDAESSMYCGKFFERPFSLCEH